MAEAYRQKCFEAKGEDCIDCGAQEDLHVHHKDRNRSNNDLENLEVLCEDCHWDRHSDEFSERASGPQGEYRETYGKTEAFRCELADRMSGTDDFETGRYRDSDWAIVDVLREGRANAPLIAERTGYSAQYIRERLGRLKQDNIVRPLGHGIYELNPDEVPEKDN